MATTKGKSATTKGKARRKKTGPKSSAEKMRVYRARLRAQGLRPIQIWVPDTRSPKFAAEARRQARLVSNSPHAKEDQAFVDALADDLLADLDKSEKAK